VPRPLAYPQTSRDQEREHCVGYGSGAAEEGNVPKACGADAAENCRYAPSLQPVDVVARLRERVIPDDVVSTRYAMKPPGVGGSRESLTWHSKHLCFVRGEGACLRKRSKEVGHAMWRSGRHSLTVATDRDRAAPRSTVCARTRHLGPVDGATSLGGTRSTRRRRAAQDRRDVGGRHHENDASSHFRALSAVTKRRFGGVGVSTRVDRHVKAARGARTVRAAEPDRGGLADRPGQPDRGGLADPPGQSRPRSASGRRVASARGIGRLLRPSHKQKARPPKGPGLPREAVRLTARAPRPVRRAQCSRTWCW
jgi:hypothetical protein